MTGYMIAIVLFNASGEYIRTDTYVHSRHIFTTAERCDQWIGDMEDRVVANGWEVSLRGYSYRFEGHPSGPFDLVCLPLPPDGYETEDKQANE